MRAGESSPTCDTLQARSSLPIVGYLGEGQHGALPRLRGEPGTSTPGSTTSHADLRRNPTTGHSASGPSRTATSTAITMRNRSERTYVADRWDVKGVNIRSRLLSWASAVDDEACAARKVIAPCHAAYLYSLMRPPRIRVRRTLPVLRPCAGCSWTSGGSWLRAWWGRCSL